MIIKNSSFVQSCTDYKKCPKPDKPEFAFIGRSNVGKSSIINFLCQRKDLSKTSSNPGKTQSINHFLINESWYLVDLPGYGYARVSKEKRKTFLQFIMQYLEKRENLVNLFVLVDASIPPQLIDFEFINWLGSKEIPFTILLTKCDKAKEPELIKNIEDFKQSLREKWAELPHLIMTSVKKKMGREEILDTLEGLIV